MAFKFKNPLRLLPTPRYLKSIKKFNQGDYEGAAKDLCKLKKRFGFSSALYNVLSSFYCVRSNRNLAVLNFYQQNYDQCTSACRINLKLEPSDVVSRNYLAHSLYHLGEFDEAIEHLQTLSSQEESRTDVKLNLAKIMIAAGRYLEAIEVLDKLIKKFPDYADFHFARGLAFSKAWNSRLAIENYTQAFELNPTFSKGILLLALEYVRIYKYQTASDIFNQGMINCPEDIKIASYASCLKRIVANIDQKTLKEMPLRRVSDKMFWGEDIPRRVREDLSYISLMAKHESSKQLELDISYGEKFTFLNPIYDKPCLNKLIEIFNERTEAMPRYADYHFKKGQLFLKTRDLKNAKAQYLRALKINPDYEDALFSLIQVYESEEFWEESLFYTEKLLRIEKNTAIYHLTHGRILLKLDRPRHAVRALVKARELDSRYLYQLYLMGHIMKGKKEYELARECWVHTIGFMPIVSKELVKLEALIQENG